MAPQTQSEGPSVRSGLVSRQGSSNQAARGLSSSYKQQSLAKAYGVAGPLQVHLPHDAAIQLRFWILTNHPSLATIAFVGACMITVCELSLIASELCHQSSLHRACVKLI